jgi:hypothetical protein
MVSCRGGTADALPLFVDGHALQQDAPVLGVEDL